MLDAFESMWSNARSTFGDGTPQTGAQFDGSAKLAQLQNSVSTAAPDGRWTGPVSSAYGAANQDHGRVLGQMAGLDQRLGAAVDQSAQVVATGRQNLDAVRNWVMAAAASVPPSPNRDQMLLAIVQKGLSRISDIVTRSNGDLTRSAVRSGSSARNTKHWGIRDSRPSRAPDPICRTSRETRKARARIRPARTGPMCGQAPRPLSKWHGCGRRPR